MSDMNISMDNDLYVNSKIYTNIYIFPSEPESYKIMRSVDKRTSDALDIRYGLRFDREWMVNTIAMQFLFSVFDRLILIMSRDTRRNKEVEASIYDAINIKVTNKVNEDSEKVGNFNVSFEPGDMLYKVLDRGTLKEDVQSTIYNDFILNDGNGNPVIEEDIEEYAQLEHMTRIAVHSLNGLTLPASIEFVTIAVINIFFEKLYEEIMMRLKNDESDTLFINMSDVIEVNALIDNGEITVYMSPGKDAKLAIKSDKYTEDTE